MNPLFLLVGACLAAPPSLVPDARFTLALYGNPTIDGVALDSLDQALSSIELENRLPRTVRTPTRAMGIASTEEYGKPNIEDLGPLSDGLGEQGASILESSQEVVIASFATPLDQVLPTLRTAYAAFDALAKASGGVVEEVSTARVYNPESFTSHVAAITVDPFDTSQIYVLVPVEDGQVVELSTQGLRAIGLQELRMPQVVAEETADMAAILCGLVQLAHEQGGLPTEAQLSPDAVNLPSARTWLMGIDGEITTSYAATRWGELRNPVANVIFSGTVDDSSFRETAVPMEGVTGQEPPIEPVPLASSETATPSLVETPTEPSTPPGAAESSTPPPMVATPSTPSQTSYTPREKVAEGSFSRSPQSLEEALTQSARALSTSVKARFQAGLPSGDHLFVKTPYLAPNRSIEYLWVEVTGWNGTSIAGVMRSEPSWVTTVQAGQNVVVSQDIVYDYLIRHADGTTEGNKTEAFIR